MDDAAVSGMKAPSWCSRGYPTSILWELFPGRRGRGKFLPPFRFGQLGALMVKRW